MARIGSLGDIVFQVSDGQILTWQSFSTNSSARWALHELSRGIPAAEFIAPGQTTKDLTVQAHVQLGILPGRLRRQLLDMLHQGKAAYLMIGDGPGSDNPYYLDGFTETERVWDVDGTAIVSDFSLKLAEYRENLD